MSSVAEQCIWRGGNRWVRGMAYASCGDATDSFAAGRFSPTGGRLGWEGTGLSPAFHPVMDGDPRCIFENGVRRGPKLKRLNV